MRLVTEESGSSFHMSREDEALCQAYRRLNIDKETEEAWWKELEAEKAKLAAAQGLFVR